MGAGPHSKTMTPPTPLHPPVRTLVIALLAAGCLGGCALFSPAPDLSLRLSSVVVPERWQQAPLADPGSPEALARWWQQLQDPLLDELISQGLERAPDLRAAQIRLRQARATRDLTSAGLFPSLGVSTGSSRSRASEETSGGNSSSRSLYNAGFDASWEPDIFGATRSAVSGAEADLAAQAASLENTRVTLVAEIARNYVEYRAYQERLQIARKNAASQQETLEITRWRAAAGLVTELDVEQARSSLEQTRATLPALENSLTASQHRLDILLGQTPGSLHARLAEVRPLPRAPEQIASGIPADTLRRRPDVLAAEQTLRAETARVDEKVAARYPSLNLSGSFGWQALSYSALGGGSSVTHSLAASLAATLFDGGRIRSQIAIQDAIQEQALVSYEQTLLTALEDVENALVAYATSREKEARRAQAAEAARNAASLASQMYQAGLTDFQSVLETQRTQLSAEDNLVSARSDILTAVIQLYKALGGGWDPAAPTSSENKDPS